MEEVRGLQSLRPAHAFLRHGQAEGTGHHASAFAPLQPPRPMPTSPSSPPPARNTRGSCVGGEGDPPASSPARKEASRAYDLRHGFAQRMLESGANHLAVAELMGHSERETWSAQVLQPRRPGDGPLEGDALKADEGAEDSRPALAWEAATRPPPVPLCPHCHALAVLLQRILGDEDSFLYLSRAARGGLRFAAQGRRRSRTIRPRLWPLQRQ